MYETLIVWIVFMCLDIALSIKRVPIAGFICGLMQFLIVTTVMLPDTEFNIMLTVVSGFMACMVIILNALDMRK